MISYIARNRRRIDEEMARSPGWRLFSPVLYGQHRVTERLVERYVSGRFIDLGCGQMPFRAMIEPRVSHYESLDVAARTEGVTHIADLERMPEIASERYDSAICLEVLEHVPDPAAALAEIWRILKPGGVLIVSAPHLSRVHEAPHDYRRYTGHGLRLALDQAGFQVEHLEARGGLASFLGHQVSTVGLGLVWGVPGLRRLAWWLNGWLVTRLCVALDRVTGSGELFAVGYTAVARRPAGDSAGAP